jgi:hypothetical protein
MLTETVTLAKKNLDSPDVTRDCGHGKLELSTLEDTALARVSPHTAREVRHCVLAGCSTKVMYLAGPGEQAGKRGHK